MKSKILSLLLLTVIFSLTIVSAANFTVSTSPAVALTRLKSNTSFSITPNLPQNQIVNILVDIPQKITDGKGHEITINPPYTINFNGVARGETKGPVEISYSGSVPSNFKIGKFTVNAVVNVTDAQNVSNFISQTVPIDFINDFCSSGENGTDLLSISSINFDNKDGDDTEWSPLDEITIEVDVSNDWTERIKEINVELGLFDLDGKNVVKDLERLNNKKIDLGSISDGKDKTAEFKFKVPTNFKEEDYILVVKAYSDDKGQKALCVSHSSDFGDSYYQIIRGLRETDETQQMIIDNIITSPETTAQCGEKVQVSAEVVNIGDTDYEDQVKITIFNKELGINNEEIIRENFDQGDSSTFEFEFDVPETAAEKTYTLEFKVYYDYDNNDDSYNLVSSKKFIKTLKVEGNCIKGTTQNESKAPQIIANLDSETPEAIAGKEVIVKATIKNPGDKETTYSIGVLENSEWSDLISIEPKSVTVAPGASKDVSIILNLNKDAEGDKEFTIKANYGSNNELTTSKKAALTITKGTAQANPIMTHLRENWFIYVIILVNLILIIAIIAVIRRIMKPRPMSM